jgi:AmpD protein
MKLNLVTGIVDQAEFIASPNCDKREHHESPEVVILHCISLPPGEYGQGAIQRFFVNQLPANEHPYYQSMAHLTVSSHFLIERCGKLIQFVPTHLRAWHAGESICLGKPKVNDFSIGIELEGLDTDENGFTVAQYDRLNGLKAVLEQAYPNIKASEYFAHSDIAPGRKPDPGQFFDWTRINLDN